MTTFTSHEPGVPNWIDLLAADVDGAKVFYAGLFGWDIEDELDADGNRIYSIARLDGKKVAGIGTIPAGVEMPSVWNSYICTADVAATAAAVSDAGGTVLMAPTQIGSSGRMASCADPTGAAFSIWEPQQHLGIEVGNEANTYSWNELMSQDLATAQTFYSDVFGWTYKHEAMPGGDYFVIAGGENGGLGGLMEMPSDLGSTPSYWGVYFTVAGLAATTNKVVALGGQVLMPGMELPGIGTFAVVGDPWGAAFTVIEPVAS